MKIETSRELVNYLKIQQALTESNTVFASSGYPEAIVEQLDAKWESSDPTVQDSFTYNLMYNPLVGHPNSIYLTKQMMTFIQKFHTVSIVKLLRQIKVMEYLMVLLMN